MLPQRVQKGQPITADLLNNIIDSIRECQIQSGAGYSFNRSAGGTTLSIKQSKQGAVAPTAEVCPFDVTGSVSGSDFILSVAAGTVNGLVPSNIFDKLTTTTSGVKYVVVNCETDGKNVVSASCAVVTSLPVPPTATINVAPTTFGVMIAAITGTLILKTITCQNVIARVSPSVQEDAEEYVAGSRNYFQYYNWLF